MVKTTTTTTETQKHTIFVSLDTLIFIYIITVVVQRAAAFTFYSEPAGSIAAAVQCPKNTPNHARGTRFSCAACDFDLNISRPLYKSIGFQCPINRRQYVECANPVSTPTHKFGGIVVGHRIRLENFRASSQSK